MSVYREMLGRALAEFDAMVAEQECRHRANLRLAGWSKQETDKAIARCAPLLEEQRERIPGLVAIGMMNAGVPIEGGTA